MPTSIQPHLMGRESCGLRGRMESMAASTLVPQAYAVYVDERDAVWLSDFGANAMVRFDPLHEVFDVFPLPSSPANVRQILGRPGEVWGPSRGWINWWFCECHSRRSRFERDDLSIGRCHATSVTYKQEPIHVNRYATFGK